MAVPAFVDSQTQDSAAAQSLTFDMSTITHSTDDFMLAFVKQSENTGAQLWDDDGAGGNGWTLQVQNRTTGGRDMECAIFWKFATSASESDPTFTWDSGGTNEPMSGMILVYSGVDTNVAFQGPTYLNSTNDANPPNPAVDVLFANTRVVCFHGATHDDISTTAAPTGFTMRDEVWNGTADDHRNIFGADIERDTVRELHAARLAALCPEHDARVPDLHDGVERSPADPCAWRYITGRHTVEQHKRNRHGRRL